jgi:uncharacterized protein (TIGR03067 family)
MPRRRSWAARVSLLAVTALAAGLGLLAAPGHSAQDKAAGPTTPLEGNWSGLSVTAGGKPALEADAKLLFLDIEGSKVTVSFRRKAKTGTIKVNDTAEPKQFDLHLEGDQPSQGIYRREKDRLTLCFTHGGPRPAQFESKEGTQNILMVLKLGPSKKELAAKEAERLKLANLKSQDENNLKQIALAMHQYHDTYNHWPMPAIYSKDGKPLLSWRVAILPFVEQNNLYNQFKLNEPWDSPHNKKLLEVIPRIYAPVAGKPKQPHSTYYQVFTGPGTVFEGEKKLQIRSISDGTSNTVMVVEAAEAVPWTKPADLPFDAKKKELPKLGGQLPDGFFMALCDGSTMWVSRRYDERILRAMITRAGGEVIDPDRLSLGK